VELILDASSATVVTALARDGAIIWTGSWLSQNDHTKRLMPEVMRGLEATSSAVTDITGVIVALGPGPFNGLRVAVAAAKGLAEGAGARVCGINTLEAEAARCPGTVSDVRPVLRAGKSGFATGRYARVGSAWHKEEEEHVVDEAALVDLAAQGGVLCGEIDSGLAGRLAGATAGAAIVCHGERTRVDALAQLGHERLGCGDCDALASLQPVYARPPHITVPKERRI
jgi:tRNA threonylcarbamoyl adenosine modification protein YeaZ